MLVYRCRYAGAEVPMAGQAPAEVHTGRGPDQRPPRHFTRGLPITWYPGAQDTWGRWRCQVEGWAGGGTRWDQGGGWSPGP